ncbi:hypothetical protein EVAR_66767_1 [Eumeta japonica]|uniref:Uncharacterized protein n=1 Tax=Eumeta variegata TaxID=151549 RepID=A0A4C1Z3M7_EUMVA|nr:hypothetical protein EVAR_66767_1 [Eumeta japonica]
MSENSIAVSAHTVDARQRPATLASARRSGIGPQMTSPANAIDIASTSGNAIEVAPDAHSAAWLGTVVATDVHNALARPSPALGDAGCVRCRRDACPVVVGTIALIANRRFGVLLADWIDHPNKGLKRERSAARSVRSTRDGSPMRAALTCGRRSIDVRRAAVGCVRGLNCSLSSSTAHQAGCLLHLPVCACAMTHAPSRVARRRHRKDTIIKDPPEKGPLPPEPLGPYPR